MLPRKKELFESLFFFFLLCFFWRESNERERKCREKVTSRNGKMRRKNATLFMVLVRKKIL
ncbi:hypothetical protein V6Z12_D08G037400 [Gossypium hirsutum]